jgi:hypothetical protein
MFIAEFNRSATANSWTDSDCCQFLPCFLRGSAYPAWEGLEPAVQENWQAVCTELSKIFALGEGAAELRRVINNRKQRFNEDVDTFSEVIRKEVERAFIDDHGFNSSMREMTKVDLFRAGLKPALRREILRQPRPKSLREAVDLARREEALQEELARDELIETSVNQIDILTSRVARLDMNPSPMADDEWEENCGSLEDNVEEEIWNDYAGDDDPGEEEAVVDVEGDDLTWRRQMRAELYRLADELADETPSGDYNDFADPSDWQSGEYRPRRRRRNRRYFNPQRGRNPYRQSSYRNHDSYDQGDPHEGGYQVSGVSFGENEAHSSRLVSPYTLSFLSIICLCLVTILSPTEASHICHVQEFSHRLVPRNCCWQLTPTPKQIQHCLADIPLRQELVDYADGITALPDSISPMTEMSSKRYLDEEKGDLLSYEEWKESHKVGGTIGAVMILGIAFAFSSFWPYGSPAVAGINCRSQQPPVEDPAVVTTHIEWSQVPEENRSFVEMRCLACSSPRCFICYKFGHIAKKCWFRIRPKSEAKSKRGKGRKNRVRSNDKFASRASSVEQSYGRIPPNNQQRSAALLFNETLVNHSSGEQRVTALNPPLTF